MRTLLATGIMVLALVWAVQAGTSPQVKRGAELYAKHCADCHRRLEVTTKPNRAYGRLFSAIRVVPSMYSLKHLSREDLEAIVAATTRK